MPHDPAAESRKEDEEGEEALVHVYRDEAIDPAEVYRELLMIELPEHPTCSPGCKGLCARCGMDLNRGPCGCAAEQTAREGTLPEWKRKLKDLKL